MSLKALKSEFLLVLLRLKMYIYTVPIRMSLIKIFRKIVQNVCKFLHLKLFL